MLRRLVILAVSWKEVISTVLRLHYKNSGEEKSMVICLSPMELFPCCSVRGKTELLLPFNRLASKSNRYWALCRNSESPWQLCATGDCVNLVSTTLRDLYCPLKDPVEAMNTCSHCTSPSFYDHPSACLQKVRNIF